MKKTIQEQALVYAKAAKNYLAKAEITDTGYGYMKKPVSVHVRAAIGANFVVAFTIEGKHDIDFVISRDNEDEEIKIDQQHMRLAIKNIGKIAGGLRRQVKFVPELTLAQKEAASKAKAAKEEKDLMVEIRRVARTR